MSISKVDSDGHHLEIHIYPVHQIMRGGDRKMGTILIKTPHDESL